MKLQFPQNGYKVVPDNFGATIKTLKGREVVLINGTHYMPYSSWAYDQFCKDAGYCDYTDMLPDWIEQKPIHSNESLLAYCYFNMADWVSIEQKVAFFKKEIELLQTL